MSCKYEKIGLYSHNMRSYDLIKNSFDMGENIVGIVHATGTGKSYNALQLAYDNKDKKIIYVVPSSGIIEHIKKIVEDNSNLDLGRDFSNLDFRTYQSFISLSENEISDINCDLLILDEFHHIGAPVWGARINTMIETHPDMKIFGMTAYTVRDRGTAYERDMADPETDELFSGKVISRYDICDAMIDGVLPKPVYKSAYTNLIGLESQLEEKVQKLGATTKEYQEYMAILNDVKRKIHEAPSIPNILKKSIKPNGKYIYFCPPCSEEGSNDIETIKQQAIEWFREFIPEEDIIIYTSTSDMGEDGKKNRDAFYNDVNLDGKPVDNKLRVMFAINQYNEGIHAPNIDGVIMGRGTTSDIVYFEQLGRALSVRGNTKDEFDELEQHSIEQLISMCKDKDISIKDNISKEELIEKLIAPLVIDLTNNYAFIKELENNLKDRIKYIQENDCVNHRNIKIKGASFDIEIENQDLFEMLRYVMDRLTMTWEDKYILAKAYYEHYGNLDIIQVFKTLNGYEYDENGIRLGDWISKQRKAYQGKNGIITEEQIKLLKDIGMNFANIHDSRWMSNYELAKAYYEHHGNLDMLASFKTINGYEYDENGIRLGYWICKQRMAYQEGKFTEEQIKLLEDIKMNFDNVLDSKWMSNYKLAKAYYEHHGNLDMLASFKTINGYEYDEKGISLGYWISKQRIAYQKDKLTEEQIKLLEDIKMNFGNVLDSRWMSNYELANTYYEHHGNLDMLASFKTINGYEYDEKGISLGHWLFRQRRDYKGKIGIITEEQIKLLEDINIKWFSDNANIKLQQEIIDSKNVERKCKEILNRFYSILNNFSDDSLPSNEELNQKFIYELDSHIKLKKLTNI